jgi:hypothetical protein
MVREPMLALGTLKVTIYALLLPPIVTASARALSGRVIYPCGC